MKSQANVNLKMGDMTAQDIAKQFGSITCLPFLSS